MADGEASDTGVYQLWLLAEQLPRTEEDTLLGEYETFEKAKRAKWESVDALDLLGSDYDIRRVDNDE